jgi:transposase
MLTLGIDVSKLTLDCYLSEGIEKKARHSCKFQMSNSEAGFKELAQNLAKRGIGIEQMTIVLEPTSQYHKALLYWLYAHKARACLVNPADVRHFAKSLGKYSKSDGLDCFVLAQFAQTRELITWQPPARIIQNLDSLLHLRHQIVVERGAAQVRLSELPSDALQTVKDCYSKTLEHFKAMEKEVNHEIQKLIDSDVSLKQKHKLLQTSPGIGPVVASLMLVIFETKQFTKSCQVPAFCGVTPKEFQSGTSVLGQTRMTKRGPAQVRAGLRMAATAIVRSKRRSTLKVFYESLLAKGKSKACALGAVMRKITLVAYAIWRDSNAFNGFVS